MLKLANDRLELRFADIHADAVLQVEFRRTLRAAGAESRPAPPDRGRFPLRDVDGHAERVVGSGPMPGGVFFPMHQGESMRIRLHAPAGYPFALQLTAGGVDAFTGRRSSAALLESFENYRVILHTREIAALRQPSGARCPFVVTPLARGPTVEEQLTGAGMGGTLQVTVFAMAAERYEALRACGSLCGAKGARHAFGPAAWDESRRARFFVHALNTRQYLEITGRAPPTPPPTAADYARAGLPWREEFDSDRRVLAAARTLVLMDTPRVTYARRGITAPASHAGIPARRPLALVHGETLAHRPQA